MIIEVKQAKNFCLKHDGFILDVTIIDNGTVRAFFGDTFVLRVDKSFGKTANEAAVKLVKTDLKTLCDMFEISDEERYNGCKLMLETLIAQLTQEIVFPI